MAITDADVKAWLKLGDTADDDLITDVVAATTAYVATIPYVLALDPEVWPPGLWPSDVTQGAIMLAARLYRRRNTPSGVESFVEGAVYLPRRDHDVDMLLHQGFYAPKFVG